MTTANPTPLKHPEGRRATASIGSVPLAAAVLGAGGAVPFVAGALGCAFAREDLAALARHVMIDYGAVILSFMGAIHWGIAMTRGIPDFPRLGVSVIPALLGWTACVIGTHVGAMILALAFPVLLAYDLAMTARGELPTWYPKLRWPLTMAASGSLLVGALS